MTVFILGSTKRTSSDCQDYCEFVSFKILETSHRSRWSCFYLGRGVFFFFPQAVWNIFLAEQNVSEKSLMRENWVWKLQAGWVPPKPFWNEKSHRWSPCFPEEEDKASMPVTVQRGEVCTDHQVDSGPPITYRSGKPKDVVSRRNLDNHGENALEHKVNLCIKNYLVVPDGNPGSWAWAAG